MGVVGLLIGGGSGHEPFFPGLAGENLADDAACGNIFAAPALTLSSMPLATWTRGGVFSMRIRFIIVCP